MIESPNFRVDVEDDGTLLVLRLHGELDLMSVPTVEDTFDRHGARQAVVVDLRDLEFMDSSGLRLIVRSHARAEQSGRSMVVVNGPDTVARVFSATDLDSKLNIVDDLASVPA